MFIVKVILYLISWICNGIWMRLKQLRIHIIQAKGSQCAGIVVANNPIIILPPLPEVSLLIRKCVYFILQIY
jgi:hypothetical protein